MRNVAPDILDVIVEPRYDTATILAAGSATLTYFASPLGGGQSQFAAAGVAKTLADTNMDLAGQLPAGYNFEVTGFRAQPSFTLTQQDSQRWSIGGVFTFIITAKPYLRVPLDTVPAGMGPFGNFTLAAAANNAMAAHGWPALSNAFGIGRKPLTLQQTQNFSVTLTWPSGAVAVTSTVPVQPAAGLPVRVYLDGFLKRIVQ